MSKKNKDFLYRSTFETKAFMSKIGKMESKASIEELESLKSLLPNQEEIKDNPDLLYTVFNCAVVNLVNQNGDAIDTATALNIAKYFKNRPTNIEHDKNNVIGYITNVGFSRFGDNSLVSQDELLEETNPFNIALSAIVWRSVDPFFAQYIEDSNDKDGFCYKDVSTSWEIGFNEFKIAVGSKNLSKAVIISDPDEIEEKKKYLARFGGTGFDEDNNELYMIISGDARPLGIGFTSNPAAAVSGVLVVEPEEDTEEKEDDMDARAKIEELSAKLDSLDGKFLELSNNLIESLQNISQSNKKTVIQHKSMKFENLDQLFGCLSEASTIEQSDASNISAFIRAEIAKADEKWKQAEQDKAQKEVELQDAISKANEATTNLDKLRLELEDIKATAKKAADQNTFDIRLSELDKDYDMSAKLIAHISSQIFGKDEDEYKEWRANAGALILEGKERKKEKPSTPEEALNHSTASVTHIPNATADKEEQKEESTKFTKVERKRDAFEITIN